MTDIEGIDRVVERLRPHMKEIEAHFDEENRRYLAMQNQTPDTLGRLLKCHLILEHYLDRFLAARFGIEDIEEARLSFFNKASLLPSTPSPAAIVKPGIILINSLRNRVAHQLGVDLQLKDIAPLRWLLGLSRPKKQYQAPIEAIEDFTTTACTWLIVTPPHIEAIFKDAFSGIQLSKL